ncbi:MAG TPA: galactose-1-phosphate uridylyltransferase [Euzebyales bacterium]|nr:galactose-1-phosphate uridylyltransferase [Euzebyales bacterium]
MTTHPLPGDVPAGTRRSVRLADGRALMYFDEQPGRAHAAVDRRDISPSRGASQIRRDALHDEWVIIAAHRQERTHLPPAEHCPLCPSRDGNVTEIPDTSYDVVVFENRFPSLSGVAASAPTGSPSTGALPSALTRGDGTLDQRRPGMGYCEVICFSDDHGTTFARLPSARLRTIGHAWVDRTRELLAHPAVDYVFCFENRGEETGVTLHHPHGQIYAYPFVPPRMQQVVRNAAAHHSRTGRCLHCDMLTTELRDGARVVATTAHFVAFVPTAARWPFEVRMYPRAHVADLPALDAAVLEEAVALQADILARFDNLFGLRMPYVSAWMQAPPRADRAVAHLYLQVFSVRRTASKLKYLAGSESAAGVFINDVLPEDAAQRLRDAYAHPTRQEVRTHVR